MLIYPKTVVILRSHTRIALFHKAITLPGLLHQLLKDARAWQQSQLLRMSQKESGNCLSALCPALRGHEAFSGVWLWWSSSTAIRQGKHACALQITGIILGMELTSLCATKVHAARLGSLPHHTGEL